MTRLLNWWHRRQVARRLAAIVRGEHECNAISWPLRTRLEAAPARRFKVGGLLDAAAPASSTSDGLFLRYAATRQQLSKAHQDLQASTTLADRLLDALLVLHAAHHGLDPDRYELLARFGIDMDPDDAWRWPLREAARKFAAQLIAEVTGTHPAERVPHSGTGGLRITPSTAAPETRS